VKEMDDEQYDFDLLEQHWDILDQEQEDQAQRTDGCTCEVQMHNAGTYGMFISFDTTGCVLHCTHPGIDITREHWACSCGQSNGMYRKRNWLGR
jgi:hypothetical protein